MQLQQSPVATNSAGADPALHVAKPLHEVARGRLLLGRDKRSMPTTPEQVARRGGQEVPPTELG
jgi:hypothetical protein